MCTWHVWMCSEPHMQTWRQCPSSRLTTVMLGICHSQSHVAFSNANVYDKCIPCLAYYSQYYALPYLKNSYTCSANTCNLEKNSLITRFSTELHFCISGKHSMYPYPLMPSSQCIINLKWVQLLVDYSAGYISYWFWNSK